MDGYTRAFLVNGSLNTFSLLGTRMLIMKQLGYNNENGVFSVVRAELL
jgi:hypothetical protein